MNRDHSRPAVARRDREGSYAILMSGLIVGLLGFGALTVDWGRARIAGSEAQAVADAAAEAAVMALKATGDVDDARAAALLVTRHNRVSGLVPELTGFEVGQWDNSTGTWSTGSGNNAVRVTVGRGEANPLTLPLARLLGFGSIEVQRSATAATQRLQVVLVMDITGSWDKDDFVHARDASVSFLDMLHNAHNEDDIVGMSVFLQRFGWEFSPMTRVEDSATNSALLRTPWSGLHTGSYAGVYQAGWEGQTSKHVACAVYGTRGTGNIPFTETCTSGRSCYAGSSQNNYANPAGGCFPNMPRYYLDEGGTDHTTGMMMARQMFQEHPDPFAYRAMIVLTDGKPTAYGSATGSKRTSQNYQESRFREYRYTGSRSVTQIQNDVVSLGQEMYAEDAVNTWFISFVDYGAFMENASQGDGYLVVTPDSSELEAIFRRIARSLPVTVVQ